MLEAGAAAGAVQGGLGWDGPAGRYLGVTPGFGVGEEKCGSGAPGWESACGNCGGDGVAGGGRRGVEVGGLPAGCGEGGSVGPGGGLGLRKG